MDEEPQYIETLARLVLREHAPDVARPAADLNDDDTSCEAEYVGKLGPQQLAEFLSLADQHHVTARALQALQKSTDLSVKDPLRKWIDRSLSAERSRIHHAVNVLAQVCEALRSTGAKVAVIKSLDHWPDLGSDMDLYMNGDSEKLVRLMTEKFNATREPRSLGDRLANKWNFRLPGLPELIEVHVRYLGQTGEQKLMAQRVLERCVKRNVDGLEFSVPAPEERILISTLQRMYRHFYFRLCDMADVAALLRSGTVDFVELRRGAELGGIWPGVATFLTIVARYVAQHVKSSGENLVLPQEIIRAASSPTIDVELRRTFLRVPIRHAAGLYGTQLLNAARKRNCRAICRLPLLPPLAVSALVAYRLTGSDKGVW